jgi:hypothetical protein
MRTLGRTRVNERASWGPRWATRGGLLTAALMAACGSQADADEQSSPEQQMGAMPDDVDAPAASGGPPSMNGTAVPEAPNVPTAPAESTLIVAEDEPVGSSECARDAYEAKRVETNLYLLLDVSGSMLQLANLDTELTLWGAVREAVKGFIGAPESGGLKLAMNYYPIQEPRSECDRRGNCVNGAFCINLVCGLEFALFDQPRPCVSDQECTLQVADVDGTVYTDVCIEPRHCSGDVLDLCLEDWQCGEGQTCVIEEPIAICPGEISCVTQDYALPDVELAALPDGAASFVQSLDAREPDIFALTPTQVALAGAYTQVQSWLDADPDAQSVMVIATDGEPNGCSQETDPNAEVGAYESAATLDAIEGARAQGITTFVIGVVPDVTGADLPEEELAILQGLFDELSTELDQMAVAGGSEAAFNVTAGDETTEGFLDALDAIRGAVLPCNYEIPEPASGPVAFDRLNVELTAPDADVGETIPKVDGFAECVQGENAWYYTMDPDTEQPTRVELCPSACEAANAQTGSRIDIVLGCQTVVRVR